MNAAVFSVKYGMIGTPSQRMIAAVSAWVRSRLLAKVPVAAVTSIIGMAGSLHIMTLVIYARSRVHYDEHHSQGRMAWVRRAGNGWYRVPQPSSVRGG